MLLWKVGGRKSVLLCFHAWNLDGIQSNGCNPKGTVLDSIGLTFEYIQLGLFSLILILKYVKWFFLILSDRRISETEDTC